MIVRESISFERGKDPMKAVGLGMEEQIKQWYRDAYDGEPGDSLIYDILNDDELDPETAKKWSLFLVSKGYNWDYEEWSEMTNKGVDFIPALPDGYTRNCGELVYFRKNGKNYIQFDGWEDWSDFIEEGRDISKESIEAILAGDAYEYFDSDYSPDVTDSIDWILKDSESGNMIKDKFLEMGGEQDLTPDLEEMMGIICDDSDFQDLEDAISYALASSQQLADESAAYKSILKELKSHFQISDPEWTGEFYISEISANGFSKILDSVFDGNEELKYSPPYYGYQGDITYDMFLEELENRLADI